MAKLRLIGVCQDGRRGGGVASDRIAWPGRRRAAASLALAALLWLLALPAARAWAPMPWGLATIWWDFPPETGAFRSLSLDMDVEGEEIGERRLYFAVIGAEEIDGAPLYAGLQSGGTLENGRPGHIAVFSRWNERSRDAMRLAPGSYGQSAGYEGDFIGVRHPVPWHQGRYRVSLIAEPPETADPRPWVRMEVLELASGVSWQVGALRFPGGPEAHLGRSLATFIEAFGPPISWESLPHITLRFGNLRINDHPVALTCGLAVYREDVPPVADVQIAGPGAVLVEIGRLHDHSAVPLDDKGRRNQRLRW
jgi:hypothetical protein